MRTYIRNTGILALALVGLAACSPAPEAPVAASWVDAVTVSTAASTVASAGSTTLTATVYGTGAFDPAVSWELVSGGGSLSADTGETVTLWAPAGPASVTVRARSAAAPDAFADATVEVGAPAAPSAPADPVQPAVEEPVAPDTTPDAFAFADVANAPRDAVVTSDAVTVAGVDAPAAVSVTGGTLVVNGLDSTAATVVAGDTVAVRVTSSPDHAATVSATVTIGGVSDAFDVTTAPAATLSYEVVRPVVTKSTDTNKLVARATLAGGDATATPSFSWTVRAADGSDATANFSLGFRTTGAGDVRTRNERHELAAVLPGTYTVTVTATRGDATATTELTIQVVE